MVSFPCAATFLNDQKQYYAKTYLNWNTNLEILWVGNLVKRLSPYKLGNWMEALKTASLIMAVQPEKCGPYLCEFHLDKTYRFYLTHIY